MSCIPNYWRPQVTEQRPAERYIHVCRERTEPDWEHAPLTFKRYNTCARVPLSAETLTALARNQDQRSALGSLGLLLHEIYGVTRIQYQEEIDRDLSDEKNLAATNLAPSSYPFSSGRSVASGGARFPGELYVLVGPGQNLASGLYHYDPAHHILNLLRAGNFVPVLLGVLAQPPETQPAYTLLFSILFWKDAFKYQEFSYRLQSLDLGCLLAQAQIVTEHAAWRPALHFRFLDRKLNQLLGLSQLEESVYAVITLDADHSVSRGEQELPPEPATLLAHELPARLGHYETLHCWPLLEAVHRASCRETQADRDIIQKLPSLSLPASASEPVIELPEVTYTYRRLHASRRFSAQPLRFRSQPLTLRQLALLLQTAQRGYNGDLGGEMPGLAHTLLYCVINQVEDVPPGIYAYRGEQHRLQLIRPGDFQQVFQLTQTGADVNMRNLSLCMIPVGNYARGFPVYGDRWYRMQNMQAGMMVQRLYLAAAMSELGCRASLSYHDKQMDMLLSLPEDYTALIQVLISPLSATAYNWGWYRQMLTW